VGTRTPSQLLKLCHSQLGSECEKLQAAPECVILPKAKRMIYIPWELQPGLTFWFGRVCQALCEASTRTARAWSVSGPNLKTSLQGIVTVKLRGFKRVDLPMVPGHQPKKDRKYLQTFFSADVSRKRRNILRLAALTANDLRVLPISISVKIIISIKGIILSRLKRSSSLFKLYICIAHGTANGVVYPNRLPCLVTQALVNWPACSLPATLLSPRVIPVCTPLLPISRA
jgi:hypothetical protein